MILIACILLGPTVHYDNRVLRQMYQSPFGWALLTQHPGDLNELSNPNAHHWPVMKRSPYVRQETGQWRVPDGCWSVKGLALRRELHIPDGKKVVTWTQVERPGDGVVQRVRHWRFPAGTQVKEFLYHDRSVHWLTRTREKISETKWDEGDVEQVRDDPPGYAPTGHACIHCHKDAGVAVQQLPGHRGVYQELGGGLRNAWYSRLRGSDTVFSWRPVDSRGRVLPQYRSFVRDLGHR